MAKLDKMAEKPFDAVRMMRLIRDEISKQIKGMTFEQEQRYIRKRLYEESAGHALLGARSDARD